MFMWKRSTLLIRKRGGGYHRSIRRIRTRPRPASQAKTFPVGGIPLLFLPTIQTKVMKVIQVFPETVLRVPVDGFPNLFPKSVGQGQIKMSIDSFHGCHRVSDQVGVVEIKEAFRGSAAAVARAQSPAESFGPPSTALSSHFNRIDIVTEGRSEGCRQTGVRGGYFYWVAVCHHDTGVWVDLEHRLEIEHVSRRLENPTLP